VNQEESEQDEVDGTKRGADSTCIKVVHCFLSSSCSQQNTKSVQCPHNSD